MTVAEFVTVGGSLAILGGALAWLGPVIKGVVDARLGRSKAKADADASVMAKRVDADAQVDIELIKDGARFREVLLVEYQRIQKENTEILRQHSVILRQNAGQEERIRTLEQVNPVLRRQRDEARRMATSLQDQVESAKNMIKELSGLLAAARQEIIRFEKLCESHGIDTKASPSPAADPSVHK